MSRRPKLTSENRAGLKAEVVKLYRAGLSIREVRIVLGVSYGTVQDIVTRAEAEGLLVVRRRAAADVLDAASAAYRQDGDVDRLLTTLWGSAAAARQMTTSG